MSLKTWGGCDCWLELMKCVLLTWCAGPAEGAVHVLTSENRQILKATTAMLGLRAAAVRFGRQTSDMNILLISWEWLS